MRKMMNKKGFTLVELMIVVVILGILVAIAVPIYSAVTENAKRKACKGDIRIFRSNLASYVMTGGEGGGMIDNVATVTQDSLYDTTKPFCKMFDNSITPACPNSGDEFTVTFEDNKPDKFTVTCSASQDDCPNGGSSSD